MTTQLKEKKVFKPCSRKQQLVLQENSVDILLMGGGAGSGKSFLSLLKAAHLSKDPFSKVMIMRLDFTMLKDLIYTSHSVFPHFGAEFKKQDKKWVFPNGAQVSFSHMPDDLITLQGWENNCYIIDEAAEFSRDQIMQIYGRLRNVPYTANDPNNRCMLIMTCNPNKQSFLFNWVNFCLDDDGVPKKGTENITRYMASFNGVDYFANSIEALKSMDALEGVNIEPQTFKFIPMLCIDNPVLLKNDPKYIGKLMAKDRVSMLRYLKGSWTAEVKGESVVTKDIFEIIDKPPVKLKAKIRGWDLATTEPSEKNNFDADWTAGVLMGKDEYGTYYILDVVRCRKGVAGTVQTLVETGIKDDGIVQIIPCDAGAAGKVAARFFQDKLVEHGVPSRLEPTNPHSNKMNRFLPFAGIAHENRVKIVRAEWNDALLNEMTSFDGERSTKYKKDDQVDALSTAFKWLAKVVTLPPISVPVMTNTFTQPKI